MAWELQEVGVAVTDGKKKCNTTLAALGSVAFALPGISTKAAVPVNEAEGNVQYGFYKEEGDRIEAEVIHGDFIVPVNDFLEVTFSYDWDTYVGATPGHSLPSVMSDVVAAASGSDKEPFNITFRKIFRHPDAIAAFAQSTGTPKQKAVSAINAVINRPIINYKPEMIFQIQPRENRDMPVFGANFYYKDLTVGLSGGMSIEPDFESNFGSISVSLDLNNKLTTLTAGYSLTSNEITRVTGSAGGHHGGGDEVVEIFKAESTFHSFDLGISQVLGKNTLFHVNGRYTNQTGYLSNPYKFVYIRGEITADEYLEVLQNGQDSPIGFSNATDLDVVGPELFREVRPDERHQWTISAGINQFIPMIDAAVHFDYRYYTDSWDISSHTFEFSWYQNFPYGITVVPMVRYYSQSAADFFAPFFLAPRTDGHYSSDYRLSGFGKLSGGISIIKQFAKGVRFNIGFEYFRHRGSLKLGGGGLDDYADIDSYLASASLQVNLSSLGGTPGEHTQHKSHVHHFGHAPAGVMFSHMLSKAGDMMVGYHYMYGDWSNGMQHGTQDNISDPELISKACGAVQCTFKPREMTMHMHMFNLMYAPTDWLNLMVMPQIVNMDMKMDPLPNDGEDGGGHVSAGLGDTLMVAMVKLFETEHHHLHLGLGFSAPTGSIEATFDDTESVTSELQSYGMQRGSGTWDFVPSLTYLGKVGEWSWGAQVRGIKRMQDRNKLGYALGDEVQGSIWAGYQPLDWLSFSIRNVYKVQGKVKGQFNRIIPPEDPPVEPEPTPLENTQNYGGKFWDIGLGVNLMVPSGEFSGHSLSIEWLQPVIHDYNGYQLERDGTLSVRWGYAF